MILVDANLLIYAYAAELPQHAAAHAWLDQQLNTLPRLRRCRDDDQRAFRSRGSG